MILHLYCILPAGAGPPAGLAGIAGAPVETVQGSALATWVTRHGEAPAASPEALRAHHAVVAAAMTPAVTPVPLRFGQRAAGEDAVRRSVGADADRWSALLARFSGCGEYGVRVAPLPDQGSARDVRTPAAATGREYMETLARRHSSVARWKAQAERIAADTLARAGELVRDSRLDPPAGPGASFSLAHLVAWTSADAYHSVIERMGTELRGLRLTPTGPWPPYSFVT